MSFYHGPAWPTINVFNILADPVFSRCSVFSPMATRPSSASRPPAWAEECGVHEAQDPVERPAVANPSRPGFLEANIISRPTSPIDKQHLVFLSLLAEQLRWSFKKRGAARIRSCSGTALYGWSACLVLSIC
jgi:hypothetical protein